MQIFPYFGNLTRFNIMQAVQLLCLEIKPLLSNVFNVTIISACRNSIFLDLFPNVYSEGWGDGDGGDNGDDGDGEDGDGEDGDDDDGDDDAGLQSRN